MIGLGHYVVPVVGNTRLASLKKGWAALILISACVLAGTLCLMAGINNGGGEYRDSTWARHGVVRPGAYPYTSQFYQDHRQAFHG